MQKCFVVDTKNLVIYEVVKETCIDYGDEVDGLIYFDDAKVAADRLFEIARNENRIADEKYHDSLDAMYSAAKMLSGNNSKMAERRQYIGKKNSLRNQKC